MIKKTFEKVDEELFIETLDNGITVYMYPTKKTKNFYLSISVKYGACVEKYKVGNKVFDIIPGSAHFLEHKVMALSENVEISKKINELGSLANAWTSYRGTNYNIFGSINIKENLRILLELFYHPDITDESVEKEKGIIGEEIDMYKDNIDRNMYDHLYKNLFNNSFMRNTVVGERSDIEKITKESLMTVYNNFYIPKNTFIIVTGDFDTKEIIEEIKEYLSHLDLPNKEIPKIIKEKDDKKVSVPYEEITKNTEDVRVKLGIKIPRKNFAIKDNDLLRIYLNIIMSNNFSATSELFEKYKNENIVISIGSGINIIDDYVIIGISAFTNDGNLFIERIKKDINKLKLTKSDFERKKKLYLKGYICDFDNIEDVEYIICESIMLDEGLSYNDYSRINNMTYEEANKILKSFEFDNISIIRTVK